MKLLMTKGDAGADVPRLAGALAAALGADAAAFPALAGATAIDDSFDAAIRRWQAGSGLVADGVVGPRCLSLLGLLPPQGDRFADTPLDVGHVSELFPATRPANIQRYLP